MKVIRPPINDGISLILLQKKRSTSSPGSLFLFRFETYGEKYNIRRNKIIVRVTKVQDVKTNSQISERYRAEKHTKAGKQDALETGKQDILVDAGKQKCMSWTTRRRKWSKVLRPGF